MKLSPLHLFSGRTLVSAALAACSTLAHANVNIINVVNGNFEQLRYNRSAQFGGIYPQRVESWTSNTANNLVFLPGTADTTGATYRTGTFELWGPNDGANNGLPASSPAGGNFLALAGGISVHPISQTLSGLTIGSDATVSFYFAGAQQNNNTRPTTISFRSASAARVTSHRCSRMPVNASLAGNSITWTSPRLAPPRSSLSLLLEHPPAPLPSYCSMESASQTPSRPRRNPVSWHS